MEFFNQLRKLQGRKREVNDNEVDTDEIRESGLTIKKGDPRLKGGIRMDNMTESERQAIRAHRQKR